MELHNIPAKELVESGNWDLETVQIPVLRNKMTGAVRFPATDGSNLVADKYICLTSMNGILCSRTRDNVNNNVINVIVKEAKAILEKQGKEELEKFILRKNIPFDWRELIFKLLNLL